MRLRELGVWVSLDDFGAGHSSLAHLKQLRVDKLKIDQPFVLNMADDSHDAAIVRSTADLAHRLHLRVIAEGVETTPPGSCCQTARAIRRRATWWRARCRKRHWPRGCT